MSTPSTSVNSETPVTSEGSEASERATDRAFEWHSARAATVVARARVAESAYHAGPVGDLRPVAEEIGP
ncbi:hypothetical protein OG535_18615 [Kitasatospora sp. NBC_00085]|uniref:hypothetical protein n=1 Tax=unclassified Kitasatospora TaxID=2633591 RepID=UPI0032488E92